MRLRILLVACAALALSVGVATAAADGGHGNSENAKACQKGGWQNWVREDGTPFRNTGDCVSYAAQSGTLTAPVTYPQSKSDCEAAGGTFSTDPASDGIGLGGTFVWSCNGGESVFAATFDPLPADCRADVGGSSSLGARLDLTVTPPTTVSTCYSL
jgi:hypothetical protein